MISSNPGILGILWLWCILHVLFTITNGQSTNKESHKVYSYAYHFQHNGTNPRDILQEILGGPDFSRDGRSIVKTISHPSLRGFVAKGVLPGGQPNDINRGAGFGSPRDISIDGIKKIVQNSIPSLPPPPPLPPIPPPPADFPGNFLKENDPGNVLKQVSKPVDRNHVVTNVENFVRHTPSGRVVGQTETFSYNPPLINNVVNNVEGFRKSEEIVSHDQRSRGHVTRSYFHRNFNRNTPDGVDIANVFGQRTAVNNHLNGNNEWWKDVGNIANKLRNFNSGQGVNVNNNFNNALRPHGGNFLEQNNGNRNYGRHENRDHGNENFARNQPNFNNLDNQNSPIHHGNRNFAHGRTNFNNLNLHPIQPGNFGNHNGRLNHVNVNNGNFGNNPIRNQNVVNNPVTWDDTRNAVFNVNNNFGDWGNRLNRIGNNARNEIAEQNQDNFGPGNARPFSNGHSGHPQDHQNQHPLPLQNPADFLKSTLEALVPDSKVLDIPSFLKDGNYKNANGGGHERFYGSDVITRGPNSFSRNTERGYQRNFELTSNNDYQLTRRWSTDNVRRLDSDSSRSDFNKDFIDVFKDDHTRN